MGNPEYPNEIYECRLLQKKRIRLNRRLKEKESQEKFVNVVYYTKQKKIEEKV